MVTLEIDASIETLDGIMDEIADNLELQLSEVEMMSSMFPSKQEFQFDDPLSVTLIQSWVDAFRNGQADSEPPSMMSYRINISLESSVSIELCAQMTRKYPSCEFPEIRLNSGALSRENNAKMTTDLMKHLKDSCENDLAMGVAVAWIQEHGLDYAKSIEEESPNTSSSSLKSIDLEGLRFWIYSHHIYSKTKRKNILDLSSEFNLTGFCMPGKPGIICLEGTARNVNDAWSVIKGWNWKKINVKIQETFKDDCDKRFIDFNEIGFVKNSDNRDYHMDMGEFFRFLKQHESEYMFKEFFGINKTSED